MIFFRKKNIKLVQEINYIFMIAETHIEEIIIYDNHFKYFCSMLLYARPYMQSLIPITF